MSRILAVDWGTKRAGLAVSDPTGILARPLATIEVKSAADLADRVVRTAREEDVETVLLGLPLTMEGEEGISARRVRRLGRALEASGLTVRYRDERLSSEDALEFLRERGDTRPAKERIDQVAALLLLQGHLDEAGHA